MNKKRSAFSGKIGYVLSAAGASVGLGNIWRFPYLAAKYGGGIFLLVYIILALTFGYTMIVAESALGRMTRKSPVGAFRSFAKGKKVGWLSFGGWINAIIPVLIVPYYSVIGGWVVKYLFEYIRGNGSKLAEDGYFSGFISNGGATEICFVIFCMFTLVIIYAGVQNGIERVSKIMMPILIVLSVIIAIYSVTRPGAIEGVKYFLVPNVKNFSWMTVVAAMGQMFYSLSIAMGILVTVTAKVARKDADGKRVKEVVDGKKVTVYDEVQKEIKKDAPSRLHARRQMMKVFYPVKAVPTEAAGRKKNTKDVDMADKMFNEIAPKYADRNGGYTRIIKIGPRKGDAAMEVVLELV